MGKCVGDCCLKHHNKINVCCCLYSVTKVKFRVDCLHGCHFGLVSDAVVWHETGSSHESIRIIVKCLTRRSWRFHAWLYRGILLHLVWDQRAASASRRAFCEEAASFFLFISYPETFKINKHKVRKCQINTGPFRVNRVFVSFVETGCKTLGFKMFKF